MELEDKVDKILVQIYSSRCPVEVDNGGDCHDAPCLECVEDSDIHKELLMKLVKEEIQESN